jgi:hypothetical protein
MKREKEEGNSPPVFESFVRGGTIAMLFLPSHPRWRVRCAFPRVFSLSLKSYMKRVALLQEELRIRIVLGGGKIKAPPRRWGKTKNQKTKHGTQKQQGELTPARREEFQPTAKPFVLFLSTTHHE